MLSPRSTPPTPGANANAYVPMGGSSNSWKISFLGILIRASSNSWKISFLGIKWN